MSEQKLPVMTEHQLRKYMQEYGSGLLKLTYTYVKNWSTAEDLVQETFITMFNKFHKFNQKSSLKTWVYQIAINKCKDYLRSPRNRLLKITIGKLNLKSDSRGLDEMVVEDEDAKLIASTLMKLPIKYREVLSLFYYESMTVKEIAEVLDITEANVKTRLKRGRDQFKNIYVREIQKNAGKTEKNENIPGYNRL